jgi:hypothetical protein
MAWIKNAWTWTEAFIRGLYPYRFSIVPIIVIFLLLGIEPSQDAIRGLNTRRFLPENAGFVVGGIFYVFNVFYWARFMSMMNGVQAPTPGFKRWAPRVIGYACAGSIIVAVVIAIGWRTAIDHIFDFGQWSAPVPAEPANLPPAAAPKISNMAVVDSLAILIGAVAIIHLRRHAMRVVHGLAASALTLSAPKMAPTNTFAFQANVIATGNSKPSTVAGTTIVTLLLLAAFFASSYLDVLTRPPAADIVIAVGVVLGLFLVWGASVMRNLATKAAVTFLLAVFGILAWLSIHPEDILAVGPEPARDGSVLGAATIIFAGGAAWAFFGTVLLAYPTVRHRLPFTLAAVLLALGIGAFSKTDNHDVRVTPVAHDDRPTLRQAFDTWHTAAAKAWKDSGHGDNEPLPLIIVATAGGATRSSYWTATVLGQLERGNPAFHKYVFAISSVSGGSLGAATWNALLDSPQAEAPAPAPDSETPLLACSYTILEPDFVAPLFLTALFSDFSQRFLPGRMFPDRATALEKAWEESWQTSFGQAPCKDFAPISKNRMAENFLNGRARLTTPDSAAWRPFHIFNGTSEKSGRRILTSEVTVDPLTQFGDAVDFLGETESAVNLSTAVHNSARFPYLDAAGTMHTVKCNDPRVKHCDDGARDRIVDGGYFENFGAATASEIRQTLLDHGPTSTDPWFTDQIEIRILQISADPEFAREADRYACWQQSALGWKLRVANDVTAPLVAFFDTRDALGYRATTFLDRVVDEHHYAGFVLPNQFMGEIPMTWKISPKGLYNIKAAWAYPQNHDAAFKVLEWLAPGTQPTVPLATVQATAPADQNLLLCPGMTPAKKPEGTRDSPAVGMVTDGRGDRSKS